jgi:AcrR family transcriptional regulator
MPKIMAPTVKEHHAQRRAALLDAARACLNDPNLRSVGFELVGPRAGIKRNSVYLYFQSELILVNELAAEDIPKAVEVLAAKLSSLPDDRTKIRTYFAELFSNELGTVHYILVALRSRQHLPEAREALKTYTTKLAEPLAEVLAKAGVAESELKAYLLIGSVASAFEMIDSGSDKESVVSALQEIGERVLS